MPGSDRLAELGDFLAALRSGGVPVGPGEVDRLRHLFARQPQLDRNGLKTLLGALLVKTPAQRQTFEALFAAWCPERAADWPPIAEAAAAAAPDGAPETAAGQAASARRPAVAAPESTAESTAESAPGRQPQASATAAIAPSPFARPTPAPRSPLRKWSLLAGAMLLVGGLLAYLFWPSAPPMLAPQASAEAWQGPPPESRQADPELPDQPVAEVWAWFLDDLQPAALRVAPRLGPLPLALLGGSALLLALALCWRYRQRFPRIVAAAPARDGFAWQPLPPPARDDDSRIDARARRQLVWNVGRFVAEDPTRRLDLPQTVARTARAGGFVQLCLQAAVYERAIWFWLDRHLASPSAQQIAAQLASTLRAAGLESREGWFSDTPQRIDWPAEPGYRPLAEEAAGRQAQVAIFSAGDGLRRQIEHALARADTLRLLRALQQWPRLCFVDCSSDGEQLAALFAAHGLRLEVVRPAELTAWLGGTPGAAPASAAPAPLLGATRQWAAALALGGGNADAASAQTLRAVLGIAASAWDVDRVVAAVADPAERRRLINWLLRSEPLAGEMPGKSSLAWRALAWWQQRYAEADHVNAAQENPLLPWRDSPAQRRWQLEYALLQLYAEPESAADCLTALAGNELPGARRAALADASLDGPLDRSHGPAHDDLHDDLRNDLREEIRARLREFSAADPCFAGRPENFAADSPPIRLTWRLAKLRDLTRRRLRALGFAADQYAGEPPPLRLLAPRLVLATTLLAALALAAFSVAAYRAWTGDPPRLRPADPAQNHPALVAQTLRVFERSGPQRYQVTLGNARESVALDNIASGAEIPLNWRWSSRANPQQLAAGVLLRAGSLAQPIRACAHDWPQRSLAIIDAPYADAGARQLAIRLLDKGSADQVLLAPQWRDADLARWLGPNDALRRQTQVLVVVRQGGDRTPAAALLAQHAGASAIVAASDFAALARALNFAGSKAIDDAALPWQVLDRRGQVRIAGGPAARRESGIDWVSLCPGSFTMGSRAGEAMADEGEIVDPPRIVTVSGFEIAASETTNAQYASLVPKHTPRDERPRVDLGWQDARSFCQQLGGDLPSEAQWEYAARGGSQTPWSFGSDGKRLDTYAWYGKNWDFGVQAVRQKRPNPLGLYDVHGNAWEWTRDWYGAYAAGHHADPERAQDDTNSGRRVLRGGSFANPPAGLRSARRVFGEPEVRLRFSGFRCVRVPPQP